MKSVLIAVVFACALSLPLPVLAQQQPDPNQALAAEWQAAQLALHHSEEAINRLIAAYEARLATAIDWLKAAQAEQKR